MFLSKCLPLSSRTENHRPRLRAQNDSTNNALKTCRTVAFWTVIVLIVYTLLFCIVDPDKSRNILKIDVINQPSVNSLVSSFSAANRILIRLVVPPSLFIKSKTPPLRRAHISSSATSDCSPPSPLSLLSYYTGSQWFTSSASTSAHRSMLSPIASAFPSYLKRSAWSSFVASNISESSTLSHAKVEPHPQALTAYSLWTASSTGAPHHHRSRSSLIFTSKLTRRSNRCSFSDNTSVRLQSHGRLARRVLLASWKLDELAGPGYMRQLDRLIGSGRTLETIVRVTHALQRRARIVAVLRRLQRNPLKVDAPGEHLIGLPASVVLVIAVVNLSRSVTLQVDVNPIRENGSKAGTLSALLKAFDAEVNCNVSTQAHVRNVFDVFMPFGAINRPEHDEEANYTRDTIESFRVKCRRRDDLISASKTYQDSRHGEELKFGSRLHEAVVERSTSVEQKNLIASEAGNQTTFRNSFDARAIFNDFKVIPSGTTLRYVALFSDFKKRDRFFDFLGCSQGWWSEWIERWAGLSNN